MELRHFIQYAEFKGWEVDVDWDNNWHIKTPKGLVIISDSVVTSGNNILCKYKDDVELWVSKRPVIHPLVLILFILIVLTLIL